MAIIKSVLILITVVLSYLFTFVTDSYADTHTAASCSYADVSAAIASASTEDTVNVPAGSCTWSSTLAITKGINLIGAGIGNTVIARGASSGLISYNPSNYSLNTPLRISGFSFNHGAWSSSSDTAIIFLGQDGKAAPYTAQTKIRIDHNRFYSSGSINDSAHAMIYRGAMYGTFDNNTIENFTYVFRNINTAYYASWYDNSATTGFGWTVGDRNKLYFEDNTITLGSTGYAYNCVTNSQYSGRYAFRYNRINVALQAYPLFDLHGYQGSDMHSSFGAEIYGNTISTGSVSGDLYQVRGGSSMVFGNNILSSGSWWYDVGTSEVACPPDYVSLQMIHDTYYWQNRFNTTGSLIGASYDGTDPLSNCGRSGNRPAEGTDFFDDSTNSGVRSGTLANRPTTCSVGQAYWATNQSTTSLSNMTGVNPSTPLSGTLYKCTSTNTWTAFFTPYTYPHPLRVDGGAIGAGDGEIQPPQKVRIGN
jgi:hypothetical protein